MMSHSDLWSSLPQFWAMFCREDDEFNNSTTTLSFSRLFLKSSKALEYGDAGDAAAGGFSSWLQVLFLKPCAHRALTALVHTFFILLYLVLITWRKIRQRSMLVSDGSRSASQRRNSNTHNSAAANAHFFSYYRAVQLSCIYLCVLNLSVALSGVLDPLLQQHETWSDHVNLDMEVSSTAQTVAWGVIFLATEHARKEGKKNYFPSLLRAWWLSAFALSALNFASVVLSITEHAPLVWDLWVEIASLPATLFLGVAALEGLTGLILQQQQTAILDDELGIHESLLNGSKTSSYCSSCSSSSCCCDEKRITLYATAGILSLATVSWLNPLLALGSQKPLELSDLPNLPAENSSDATYKTFQNSWEALQKKKKKKEEEEEEEEEESKEEENCSSVPSISLALFLSFWRAVVLNALFAFLTTVATYTGPYLINDFVEYLGGRRRFTHEGFVLVFIFFSAKLIENLSRRQWCLEIQLLGLKIKAALTAVVFRKALRLSSGARQSHSSGEIINYMSVDVQRLSDFAWYLHHCWLLPLEILMALGILYKVVGMAWIAALAAACFTLLLNTPIEKCQEKYQDKVMEAKDERMKATAEALRNMRVLKLQAWEKKYLAKIEELRLGEYGWLLKDCIARAVLVYSFWLAPVVISVSTFGTCILLGIPLTAGRILSAIATFGVLQEALSSFPELISVYAQTKVSLDRIWNFLQEEELPKDAVIHVPKEQSGGVAIEIKGGEFSWNLKFDNEQEQQQQLLHQNTLSNINLQVKSGSCVAICGTVGSGKSSLLSCILGEIPKLAGTVKVSGTTAYVTQTAWIQSGKVEDNIRFGTPMDRVRYNAVLEACALKKDLELWAFGDQTEIGERGINMSGGQKQRIQLARALYQDSDVYLLDDPFSAVDAHTGSQLFRECILEMLASKTVIYVTHQVEFLPAADLILVLDKGQIVQAGKYDELLQAGTNFTALVEAHNEAIDSMDVSDNFGDDHGMEIMPDECFLDGVENHHVGDEVHKLQKQMHSRKSSFADLRKQTSKREKLELDLDDKNRQLIVEEAREKGDVSLNVYWSYITSIHKGLFTGLSVVAQSCFLLLQIGSNYWMAWASPTIDGDPGKMKNSTLILVYAGLAFGSSFFVAMRSIFVSLAGVFVAQKYFLDMIRCLFRAPMSFFDATPAGRILNRASADQSKLDLEVQYNLSGLAMAILQLLGILVVMSQVSLVVPLVFLPVAATCLWMEHYYMRSAREVARIMGVEKAPLLNHYGESIAGAPTIRAFGQDQQFMNTNIRLFDNYGRPCFFNFTLMEWLIFRMELLCNFVFSFAMVLVVLLPDNTISPSLTGLAVTYGLNLNIVLVGVIWNLCNLQTKIISVERIQQYTCIPSEAPLVIESRRPPPSWPSHGTIELQHLQIQYNQYSPLVLHGITCTFHGGKKVGVVGRTGSGKSTLIQALFRIVEPSGGRIVIDNLDISTIGLHDLRSKLSIIPQDPTLFEGTMRTNLDPLNEHTDIEVWEALDKCQLGDIMRSKDQKLDAPVGENGENWSAGQRQLVCLGRALLKHTRILVLDEATASVDSATDNLIQRTLRTEFSSCTVLTIAHRIPTVIDSDKVLVLSDGRVSEYDVPIRLLENKNSLFAKLVIEYSLRSTSCHS